MGDGAAAATRSWPHDIYDVFKEFKVRQVPYVPDGGHIPLIEAVHADPEIHAVPLTTEEEGIAMSAGAWLGGHRSVLLMQSSGVGNCANMFSLTRLGNFPFLTLVTMRGEFGEFNPWQVPMGTNTPALLAMSDLVVLRADHADEVREVVRNAANMAFNGGARVAVLLSQRLIGAKVFVSEDQ
ncbi:MAG: thiamine pyrophosphate-binding protein [Burkholderiaceae bacterium]